MLKKIIYFGLIIIGILALIGTGLSQVSMLNLTQQSKKKTETSETVKIPEGHLPLSHFSFEDMAHLQIWSMVQDSSGLMLFATPRGLISFNGQSENFTAVSAIPYRIKKNPYNQKIYAACEHGFGQIKNESYENYEYEALNSPENDMSYTDLVFLNHQTYFIGEEAVAIIDSTDKLKTKILAQDTLFSSWFSNDSSLFVRKNTLFYDILNPDRILSDLSTRLAEKRIVSYANFGDTSLIITNDSKLYKYSNRNLIDFEVESQEYFTESMITGSFKIDANRLAVSSLNGGVLIINIHTGKTDYTINYRTGLPDDEVFAMGADSESGIWIAHEYGLSRADLSLPIRDFSHYPGLEGKINSLQISDSVIYVATGKGVYYLSEISDFDEIQVLIEKSEKEKKQNIKQGPTSGNGSSNSVNASDEKTDETGTTEETETEDNRLIDRWKNKWRNKRNKNDKEEESSESSETDTTTEDNATTETTETTETVPANPVSKPKTYTKKKIKRDESRKTYELQSVNFAFKKTEGLDSKCKQLCKTKLGLFAVSNDGVYQIVDGKAKSILKNSVNDIYESANGVYLAGATGLFYIEEGSPVRQLFLKTKEQPFLNSVTASEDKIWLGGMNRMYSFLVTGTPEDSLAFQSYEIKSEFPERITARKLDGMMNFFSTDGVYEYNPVADSMQKSPSLSGLLNYRSKIFFPGTEMMILKEKDGIVKTIGTETFSESLKYLFFGRNQQLIYFADNAIWNVGGQNELMKIITKNDEEKNPIQLKINKISLQDSTEIRILKNKPIVLPYDYGKLVISMSAISYIKQNSVKIYYALDNETDFTPVNGNILSLPGFSYGPHTIKIYAENVLHETGDIVELKFNVKAPFWYSTIFWIVIAIAGITFGGMIAFLLNKGKNKRMQRRNDELEAEVQRRTQKIQEQNAEIQAQNDEILERNKQIGAQNKQISHQHAEITDSIRYASRIQSAVLPSREVLKKYIGEHFIYFNPRDIVSGDFYWFHKIDNEVFIAAADCTGHGVPGGFLSMLGISFLNEIVIQRNIHAGEILDKLRLKVIKSLNQSRNSEAKDGMDIALVKINTETLVMEYAGANNLIYLLRGQDMETIKPDRMPVGYHRKLETPFSTTEIQLQKDDRIYMFSDGYVDQFSEKTRRKFTKARLSELLFEIRNLSMSDQHDIVESMLLKWKGNYIQIDDILLIGIKV